MIIGISGKMQSGKDTVGKIIQYLTDIKSLGFTFNPSEQDYSRYIINKHNLHANWKIKRYGDKLKQIISLLTGIPVEDLEKIEVKNRVLGKEWDYQNLKHISSIPVANANQYNNIKNSKLTPRKLLQLIGTECGRNIIHPNIWVNALFSDYIGKDYSACKCGYINENCTCEDTTIYPNWIITDVRFPNELDAIEDREGFVIRVNSNFIDHKNQITRVEFDNNHKSEIALDDHNFDDYIDNNGTIEELIKQVKEILIKHKLL